MHEFDQWLTELNKRMIAEHYHAVSISNSLMHRLYAACYDGACTLDDALYILHQQWVNDANLFANKLLEQVQQGVTYTVWHEYLANNQNHSKGS